MQQAGHQSSTSDGLKSSPVPTHSRLKQVDVQVGRGDYKLRCSQPTMSLSQAKLHSGKVLGEPAHQTCALWNAQLEGVCNLHGAGKPPTTQEAVAAATGRHPPVGSVWQAKLKALRPRHALEWSSVFSLRAAQCSITATCACFEQCRLAYSSACSCLEQHSVGALQIAAECLHSTPGAMG